MQSWYNKTFQKEIKSYLASRSNDQRVSWCSFMVVSPTEKKHKTVVQLPIFPPITWSAVVSRLLRASQQSHYQDWFHPSSQRPWTPMTVVGILQIHWTVILRHTLYCGKIECPCSRRDRQPFRVSLEAWRALGTWLSFYAHKKYWSEGTCFHGVPIEHWFSSASRIHLHSNKTLTCPMFIFK